MGATSSAPGWLATVEAGAPDSVAAWRALGNGFAGLRPLRRVLRARVHLGDAARILAEQEVLAEALADALSTVPDAALAEPGGEEDWNVAQTFAHATAARRFLPTWAALDAAGRWPADDPPKVRASIPGAPAATRDELLVLLGKSRRAQQQVAETVAGHETDRCRLDHPLIGRLRCGDWLLFAGVHDLMHLEQLHRIADEHRGGS
jgi:DinB superfamily